MSTPPSERRVAFNIGTVESFERNMVEAQKELGIAAADFVPVRFKLLLLRCLLTDPDHLHEQSTVYTGTVQNAAHAAPSGCSLLNFQSFSQ